MSLKNTVPVSIRSRQDFESPPCPTKRGDHKQERNVVMVQDLLAPCSSSSLHSGLFSLRKLILFLRLGMHRQWLESGYPGQGELAAWR